MSKLTKIASAVVITVKYNLVAISIATLIALPVTEANAGNILKKLMDDSYGTTMSNSTSANHFKSASRNVFSGGGVTVRSKIFNSQPITFTPPSFNAGCGGIDFYAGSFSFINKDQIVQLFRAIAQNALGYLFKLALQQISPAIDAAISWFQSLVQKLNNFLGNSCQIAQGVSEVTKEGLGDIKQLGFGLANKAKGIVDDAWSGVKSGVAYITSGFKDDKSSTDPDDGGTQAINADGSVDDQPKAGNIVYKIMKKLTAAESKSIFKGDDIGDVIAIVGARISKGVQGNSQGAQTGSNATSYKTMYSNIPWKVSLTDLVEDVNPSENILTYKCKESDECANPGDAVASEYTKGKFKHEIVAAFCGGSTNAPDPSCTSGLLSKWADPAGKNSTDLEQKVIGRLPPSFVSSLSTFVKTTVQQTKNRSSAPLAYFIDENSGAIATQAAYIYINEIINNVYTGLGQTHFSEDEKKDTEKDLRDARDRLKADYNSLIKKYGDIANLESRIKVALENRTGLAHYDISAYSESNKK